MLPRADRGHDEVLSNRQATEEMSVLECPSEAMPRSDMRLGPGDVMPIEVHTSGIGKVVTADDIDQR